MKHKSLEGIQIKQGTDGEPTGEVTAVFATLGVIDHDGDVTLPGAFADGAAVRISAYNHASWGPASLPVGKGTIRESGNEAIFEGQFFMNTQTGRETFEVVKELADLGEWSYGYDVLESSDGAQEGQQVEFLKKVAVYEVSPVLLGAGLNTRTLAVKGKQLSSEIGQRLCEAGRERWGTANTYVYLMDYDSDEGYAVFEVWGETTDRYVRTSYMRGADGSVALASEETDVEPRTSYEPTSSSSAGADGYASIRSRAAALTGAKAEDLPEPDDDEGLRDYDARIEAKAVELAVDEDGAGDPERPKMTLTDHLAWATAEVEAVTDRLAEVVASRTEKGKDLGDASREAAEQLEAGMKTLREVLASAAENDDSAAWGEGLEIEHQLLTASAH